VSNPVANMQKLALKGVLEMARQGMADGMTALLDVATDEMYPATPEDTGALRASGSAFVDRKLVKVNPQEVRPFSQVTGEPAPIPTPALTHAEPIDPHAITGMVVFNQDYAEDVHEGGPRNWTTPGTGDKFLELKVQDVGQATAEVIADRLSKMIGD